MPVSGIRAHLVTAFVHCLDRTECSLFGTILVLLALMKAHKIILELVPSFPCMGTLLLNMLVVLALRTTGARLLESFIFRRSYMLRRPMSVEPI